MSDSVYVSRRYPSGVEPRALGWWGTVLLVMVMATSYAAMYFTYVYVRVASLEWPPPGIDPPQLATPAAAVAALAASAVAMRWAVRREAARALLGYRLALLVTAGLAAAHFAALLADWAAQPFTIDQHAYGSLYYVLPGIHLVVVGVGVLTMVVLLALSRRPDANAMVHLGTRSLAAYWYMTVVGGVLLLAVVYLLPHLWREAIAA